MRLVGWLSASGRPENFPGCNRHVTANLGAEMHDLTRELSSRCEENASHALKSCARGSFRPRGLFRVEILSKVTERLEKSKNGDGSVLRTHAKGGVHRWVAERMVRCAEKLVGSDLPPKNGRSGRPHKASNNTCAPSQLPYMVWLVGWLGGRPIRPGFGIGVAISQVKKPLARSQNGLAGCGSVFRESIAVPLTKSAC